jgi:hypothetical protein
VACERDWALARDGTRVTAAMLAAKRYLRMGIGSRNRMAPVSKSPNGSSHPLFLKRGLYFISCVLVIPFVPRYFNIKSRRFACYFLGNLNITGFLVKRRHSFPFACYRRLQT